MMQKIQRFGGAMFTPVLLFAFSGIVIGVCTVFQSDVIMGSIAASDTTWFKVWYVVKEAAWTIFRQVNLLFVISLPIGLAKKQNARACMESFVLYCTFNYALAALLSNWGSFVGIDYAIEAGSGTGLASVASIKTLDTGMVGALIVAGVAVWLHNRYFDTKLPEWLGVFRGSSFVAMIGFPVMIGLAVIFFFIWPQVQHGIAGVQTFIISSGALGVWVYTFLERILIPTGLHHFIYMPFMYDSVAIEGGIKTAWVAAMPEIAKSTASLRTLFPAGGYALYGFSKMFAPLGISAAFYATAKENKKKEVLGLMIPVTLTAMFAGITEPIEFTFLFIAPWLFIVHALLAATLSTTMYMAGIVGIHAGGVIEMASLNWIPLMGSHWKQYLLMLGIGLVFTGIWFVVFKFLIEKFDVKTPGREDDEEVTFHTKADYKEKQKANKSGKVAATNDKLAFVEDILEGLGGYDNIVDVTNCATRLRVNVKDETLCKDDPYFKSIGAHGCSANGKSYQVIVGLKVPKVRDDFETLLSQIKATV